MLSRHWMTVAVVACGKETSKTINCNCNLIPQERGKTCAPSVARVALQKNLYKEPELHTKSLGFNEEATIARRIEGDFISV